MYVLTEEGKKYLEKGLPEKRLVEILKNKPLSIKEAKEKIENFSIALMWAKKNGWVEIKEGNLILKKLPEEFPVQKALEKISKGEPIEAEELKILLKRNLIKKVVKGKADELIGKEITQIPPELLKTGLWRKVKLLPYDVDIPSPEVYAAKIHPYRQVINQVRTFLLSIGFKEVKGPLVELNFWNCDALFMPSDHPARGIHDIFETDLKGGVKNRKVWKLVEKAHKKGIAGSIGWGSWDKELAKKIVLRSQCTAVSARTLAYLKASNLPVKIFTIDKVFRPDVIDAKHFIEFEQCEGIVVSENLNFRHLLGYLKEISKLFGAEKVKFKPSYFPFTEPSVEMYNYIKGLGWVETGGAGIFRPEVTKPLGVSVPVLAWGLGIGRLAMLRLGVNDIRYLYSDDLQWLRESRVV